MHPQSSICYLIFVILTAHDCRADETCLLQEATAFRADQLKGMDAWCTLDVDSDGFVTGRVTSVWNDHKFMSADMMPGPNLSRLTRPPAAFHLLITLITVFGLAWVGPEICQRKVDLRKRRR